MVPTMFESTKTAPEEVRTKGIVRRSTRQRGLPIRIHDCDLFLDNKVNDYADFFHFALMTESRPSKMGEALSDPK